MPTPASPGSPCWGTGEQPPRGGACGPPSPDFCPLLHCSWGQTPVLLGQPGHCGGASAPLPLLRRVGLGPGEELSTEGPDCLQCCSAWGAPGPGWPWDGSEEPWPVWGSEPEWGRGLVCASLGVLRVPGSHSVCPLLPLAFSIQHPAGWVLCWALAPHRGASSPGHLGVRRLCAGPRRDPWACDRVEEYVPRR